MKRWIKGIFGYLFSIGLALVFALYLSGRVGWFLVLVFVLAPFLSILMTWLLRNRISVAVSWSTQILNKGERGILHISVENRGFLPSPIISLKLGDSFGVRCMEKQFLVSVLFRSTEEFETEYIGCICGKGRVEVRDIKIKDYFGLFSFSLKFLKEQDLFKEIAVIPNITQVSEREEVIEQVALCAAQADDSEDTTESKAFAFAGFPGYQSREYIQGDPLKRINWKLSAKRDKLMVRLDDEIAASAVTIVLDPVFLTEEAGQFRIPEEFAKDHELEEQFLLTAQAAVEGSLGIAVVLLKKGYALEYRMRGEMDWNRYVLTDERDLSELRMALAYYQFSDDIQLPRLPEDNMTDNKTHVSVFCTPAVDSALAQQLRLDSGSIKNEIVLYAILSVKGESG